MASSTTKPRASVSASSVTLSSEKPIRAMPAKVAATDNGSATAGMIVARQERRNARITSTTSTAVMISVSCTSCTDSLIDTERSERMSILTVGGSTDLNVGIIARIASVTATVLESGWRWMLRMIERLELYSASASSFSTESTTFATSSSRTGAPLRHAITIGLK